MKYMGIDYGARRIGIAVSDEGGMIAFPKAVIDNDDKALVFIRRLMRDEKVAKVIIGDTRTVSGAENAITGKAENFARKLSKETGIPVAGAFEAWSSVEAARYDPEGDHDDSAAAAIILQRFLEMNPGK